MDPTHIDLFDLAERRLAWADQRQAVLAQNVANANTPGYKPHDLRSFADMLAGTSAVAPVRTQPNHLAGTAGGGAPGEVVDRSAHAIARRQRRRAGRAAPEGGGHRRPPMQLVTTIYKKYLGMFGMALGRGAIGLGAGRSPWISTRHSASPQAAWTAQTTRLRVIAENLANQDTTGSTPGADPYRRKTVTFENRLDRQLGRRRSR